VLADGEALLACGYFLNGSETILTTAELYNPSSGAWSVTGSMTRGVFTPGFCADW
jgi:hypothetical protein